MRFIILVLSFLVLSFPAFASKDTTAKQAYVIDYETGQVLLNKNSDEKMPTSSMSKVMTIYMVFDALKQGAITMDTEFNVSEAAWSKGGSKMFVPLGKTIKVEDLIRGVTIQSGNDATIVLAEGLAGSEENFAKKMTAKAHEIGMKNSNFMNASGWPDADHYSTAQDLAIMARHMIEGFPEYYKFFSEKEYTYNNIKQQNRNPLLYRNVGADGLKTGHTELAGYGLIGTAVKDGRRVLMVVNGLASEKDRADEAVRLIEWALNNFTNKDIFKKGDIVTKADVALGKVPSIPLIIEKDIKVTVPKFPADSYSVQVKYDSPLIAPVKAGQEVGTMTIIIPDAENISYPIVAGADVEKLGMFQLTIDKIKRKFLGKL